MSSASYRSYAGRIIRKHAKAFLREASGVTRSADIEFLHRMRVSSRRLRTALWVFRDIYDKKKLRRLRRSVREVSRILGTARDLDTQIAFLHNISRSSSGGLHRTAEEIILTLRTKRRQAQKDIRNALARPAQRKIRLSLQSVLRTQETLKKAALLATARKKIQACLKKLLGYAGAVRKAERIEELHRMRIAAKRLRYTMENFREFYGEDMAAFIAQAKAIQDTLGDMHNYYVWMQDVPQTPRGRLLLMRCRRGMATSYRAFRRAWKEQKEKKTWKKLKKRLD